MSTSANDPPYCPHCGGRYNTTYPYYGNWGCTPPTWPQYNSLSEVWAKVIGPQTMKVKKLISSATLPTKAHDGDLGYDLYSAIWDGLAPGETKLISTGISIEFPNGYGGIIKDRSSIAYKYRVTTSAGVIDNGYTGEIKILMTNHSELYFAIKTGDKLAQLILIPTKTVEIEEVDETNSADGRGDGGFGSTGA